MKYPESASSTLEWKSSFPEKEQIVKTVIGFCNRFGGKLVIGVANNGEIVGIEENTAEEQMEHLDKMIYESSAPPKIARATAGRRLNSLVRANKLKKIGSGKATSYRKAK